MFLFFYVSVEKNFNPELNFEKKNSTKNEYSLKTYEFVSTESLLSKFRSFDITESVL